MIISTDLVNFIPTNLEAVPISHFSTPYIMRRKVDGPIGLIIFRIRRFDSAACCFTTTVAQRRTAGDRKPGGKAIVETDIARGVRAPI
ncbi:hypothetical protein [Methylocystis sp. ATCC 49242]|uniref:hypothetical protein n=1 Tax=Methylocystis sp. ATCC 49242 TaxID=622637 RepID=UPI001186BB00|nr:hypothetical protein [Methylocystis sp. ATCC 49242]